MAGTQPARGGIIAGINVTPLVDITLVLLIIFIVTAKIMVTPAMPVDLPAAASGDEVQVIFSTVLTADGQTLVNGSAIASDQALIDRAREARDSDPDLRAVLHADGDVPHRRVMGVMDALKQAGIHRIAFAVVQAPVGAGPSAPAK